MLVTAPHATFIDPLIIGMTRSTVVAKHSLANSPFVSSLAREGRRGRVARDNLCPLEGLLFFHLNNFQLARCGSIVAFYPFVQKIHSIFIIWYNQENKSYFRGFDPFYAVIIINITATKMFSSDYLTQCSSQVLSIASGSRFIQVVFVNRGKEDSRKATRDAIDAYSTRVKVSFALLCLS